MPEHAPSVAAGTLLLSLYTSCQSEILYVLNLHSLILNRHSSLTFVYMHCDILSIIRHFGKLSPPPTHTQINVVFLFPDNFLKP